MLRLRILKETDHIQAIENYMFEDHPLIRRAAVQCWTNLCSSPYQVFTATPAKHLLVV